VTHPFALPTLPHFCVLTLMPQLSLENHVSGSLADLAGDSQTFMSQ
jgi:hypothetical protein